MTSTPGWPRSKSLTLVGSWRRSVASSRTVTEESVSSAVRGANAAVTTIGLRVWAPESASSVSLCASTEWEATASGSAARAKADRPRAEKVVFMRIPCSPYSPARRDIFLRRLRWANKRDEEQGSDTYAQPRDRPPQSGLSSRAGLRADE